jgi:hypothetical protein
LFLLDGEQKDLARSSGRAARIKQKRFQFKLFESGTSGAFDKRSIIAGTSRFHDAVKPVFDWAAN